MSDSDRIAALEREVELLRAQILGFPVRIADVGSGGGTTATIAGTLVVATGTIPPATETTFGQLPQNLRTQLDPNNQIPAATKAYQLNSHEVQLYDVVVNVVTVGFGTRTDVYAVPRAAAGGIATGGAYSTVRIGIAPGKLLQCKQLKANDGSSIPVVDVEPC